MAPKALARGVAAKAEAKAALAGKAKAQSAGRDMGGGVGPQGTLRPAKPGLRPREEVHEKNGTLRLRWCGNSCCRHIGGMAPAQQPETAAAAASTAGAVDGTTPAQHGVQQLHWQVILSTSPLNSRRQLLVLLYQLRARPKG